MTLVLSRECHFGRFNKRFWLIPPFYVCFRQPTPSSFYTRFWRPPAIFRVKRLRWTNSKGTFGLPTSISCEMVVFVGARGVLPCLKREIKQKSEGRFADVEVWRSIFGVWKPGRRWRFRSADRRVWRFRFADLRWRSITLRKNKK